MYCILHCNAGQQRTEMVHSISMQLSPSIQACVRKWILKFLKYGVGYWWRMISVSALRDSVPLCFCTTIIAPVSECQWIVLTVSFGCGKTRLPVDGLTVEQSLESDAMLALSSDSSESAELIIHRRFTNGLPLEPAAVEWTKQDIYSTTTSFHILAHSCQLGLASINIWSRSDRGKYSAITCDQKHEWSRSHYAADRSAALQTRPTTNAMLCCSACQLLTVADALIPAGRRGWGGTGSGELDQQQQQQQHVGGEVW